LGSKQIISIHDLDTNLLGHSVAAQVTCSTSRLWKETTILYYWN